MKIGEDNCLFSGNAPLLKEAKLAASLTLADMKTGSKIIVDVYSKFR